MQLVVTQGTLAFDRGVEMDENLTPAPEEKAAQPPQEVQEEAGEPINAELEELKKRFAEVAAQAEELKDKWLRAAAELENFKRRSLREREEMIRQAQESLIREFLPILDNLQRALAHANNQDGPAGLVEGIRMIERQFSSTLERLGVVPIEALHRAFDPGHHEAMVQVESEEYEPNTVVEELEKGYLWRDRLLRPAKVAVAKRKEA